MTSTSTTSCIEEKEIVIVGGGICGLATALALHKKGISSTVLERAESVRTSGAAIGIYTNGWRALDQLGVATHLRTKAIPIKALRDITLEDGKQQELPLRMNFINIIVESDAEGVVNAFQTKDWGLLWSSRTVFEDCLSVLRSFDSLSCNHISRDLNVNADKLSKLAGRFKLTKEWEEELRCLRRSDLIQIFADRLPLGTIRFGCHIVAAKLDPLTSQPLLQLRDGTLIKSKVVIGCDGVNSVVSELIGLKAPRLFSVSVVRGFTSYPSGHGFSNEFIRIRRGNLIFGRMPVDDNLAYWFVGRPSTSSDSRASKEPDFIKQATVESIKDFPTEFVEMVKNSDLDLLPVTNLRYRAPWEILLGIFRKGTVVVAGDAMHVMGPFLGQGGSAALEDAVVLARNLAQEMSMMGSEETGQVKQARIGTALDRYIKERRMRLLMLSTQTYLTGMLFTASSQLTKLVLVISLIVLFGNSLGHTRYNCGRL